MQEKIYSNAEKKIFFKHGITEVKDISNNVAY